MLSPDLRERTQAADTTRKQRVRLRLLRERTTNERIERQAGAERRTQIHLVVAEETGTQAAVRRQTYPVAAAAVGVRHRRDHADATEPTREPMIRRRAVAACGARNGLQRA